MIRRHYRNSYSCRSTISLNSEASAHSNLNHNLASSKRQTCNIGLNLVKPDNIRKVNSVNDALTKKPLKTSYSCEPFNQHNSGKKDRDSINFLDLEVALKELENDPTFEQLKNQVIPSTINRKTRRIDFGVRSKNKSCRKIGRQRSVPVHIRYKSSSPVVPRTRCLSNHYDEELKPPLTPDLQVENRKSVSFMDLTSKLPANLEEEDDSLICLKNDPKILNQEYDQMLEKNLCSSIGCWNSSCNFCYRLEIASLSSSLAMSRCSSFENISEVGHRAKEENDTTHKYSRITCHVATRQSSMPVNFNNSEANAQKCDLYKCGPNPPKLNFASLKSKLSCRDLSNLERENIVPSNVPHNSPVRNLSFKMKAQPDGIELLKNENPYLHTDALNRNKSHDTTNYDLEISKCMSANPSILKRDNSLGLPSTIEENITLDMMKRQMSSGLSTGLNDQHSGKSSLSGDKSIVRRVRSTSYATDLRKNRNRQIAFINLNSDQQKQALKS